MEELTLAELFGEIDLQDLIDRAVGGINLLAHHRQRIRRIYACSAFKDIGGVARELRHIVKLKDFKGRGLHRS